LGIPEEAEVELLPMKRKSGNSSGRPTGSVSKFSKIRHKVSQVLSYNADKVLDNLAAHCMLGDPNPLLMKLFLLYWAGPPKELPVCRMNLGPVRNAEELRQAMLEVHRRVTAGEISAEIGKSLVEMQHRILHAYSIESMGVGQPLPAQVDGGARKVLRDKLLRAIEARKSGLGSTPDNADCSGSEVFELRRETLGSRDESGSVTGEGAGSSCEPGEEELPVTGPEVASPDEEEEIVRRVMERYSKNGKESAE